MGRAHAVGRNELRGRTGHTRGTARADRAPVPSADRVAAVGPGAPPPRRSSHSALDGPAGWLVDPQLEMERCAAVGIVLGPDHAAIRLDQGACDRESESEAILLRREEGLENLVELMRRNSMSAI